MPTSGILTIAYGLKAKQEAIYAMQSAGNAYPFSVVTDDGFDGQRIQRKRSNFWAWRDARQTKVTLFDLSPYDYTLYTDADTRIRGDISTGFDILADGWDMVIIPGRRQDDDHWWHIEFEEREASYVELGYIPTALQGGVFWFVKNERTKAFFAAWAEEWKRWQGQDMAALVRALHRVPLKLWYLGHDFNGGPVIQHLYGRCQGE
jgi:hypothetical protein